MSPKEAAESLIKKHEKEILKIEYMVSGFVIRKPATACALICVEEILGMFSGMGSTDSKPLWEQYKFWQQVKAELQKP